MRSAETWESQNVINFLESAKPGDFIYSTLPAKRLYGLAYNRPATITVRAVIGVGIKDDAIHDRLNRIEITEHSNEEGK